MPRKGSKRKRSFAERLRNWAGIVEKSPQLLLSFELYDTWHHGEFTPIALSLRGHVLQLSAASVALAPIILCLLLVVVSLFRTLLSRKWLWSTVCDVGWMGLSALMVFARPDSLAVKLCLTVFVLLVISHRPWRKFFGKRGSKKSPEEKLRQLTDGSHGCCVESEEGD